MYTGYIIKFAMGNVIYYRTYQ